MADNFDRNTKIALGQVDNSNNLQEFTNNPLAKNCFLYGYRRPLDDGEISLPVNSLSNKMDYYKVYQVPPSRTSSALSILSYFRDLGFRADTGLSGVFNFENMSGFSASKINPNWIDLYFNGYKKDAEVLNSSRITGSISFADTEILGTLENIETGEYSTSSLGARILMSITTGSPVVTIKKVNAYSLQVGATIIGTGIPVLATIASIESATSITLSASCTATNANLNANYYGLSMIADTKITVSISNYGDGLPLNGDLLLDYVRTSDYSDPNVTEPFIQNIFTSIYVVNSAPKKLNPELTFEIPNIYYMILPDEAHTDLFKPSGSVWGMTVAPYSVNTANAITTIKIPLTGQYIGYVPSSGLGNSLITQATTNASGKIISSNITGLYLTVELENVTGTFNTTNLLNLVLDEFVDMNKITQDFFQSRYLSLSNMGCNYEVMSNADITGKYSSLFNYIQDVYPVGSDGINAPVNSWFGQGTCRLIFGNYSMPMDQVVNLYPTKANDCECWTPIYDFFKQRAGMRYRSFAETVSAIVVLMACNVYPFNPFNDVYLGFIEVSPYEEDRLKLTYKGVADTLLQKNITIIGINNNGEAVIPMGQSGKLLQDGQAVNSEFTPSCFLDGKDYLKLNTIAIAKKAKVGHIRQDDSVYNNIRSALIESNNNIEFLSQERLNLNNSKIVVRQDSVDSTAIYIERPTTQKTVFGKFFGEITSTTITIIDGAI
jgi:hypothetical protein